jgi:hypothetical protein
MFTIDVTLKNTPLSLSVQRKTVEDADALYEQIKAAMQSNQSQFLDLTCDRHPEKKIGILSNEISAVQISEKSSTTAASGRPPGFAFAG